MTQRPICQVSRALEANPLSGAEIKTIQTAIAKECECRKYVERFNSSAAAAAYEVAKAEALAGDDLVALESLGTKDELIAKYASKSELLWEHHAKVRHDSYKQAAPSIEKIVRLMEKRAAKLMTAERELAEALGVAFDPSSGSSTLLATALAWRRNVEHSDQGRGFDIQRFFEGLVDFSQP